MKKETILKMLDEMIDEVQINILHFEDTYLVQSASILLKRLKEKKEQFLLATNSGEQEEIINCIVDLIAVSINNTLSNSTNVLEQDMKL